MLGRTASMGHVISFEERMHLNIDAYDVKRYKEMLV